MNLRLSSIHPHVEKGTGESSDPETFYSREYTWSSTFKDPTTTAAAVDRLVHHSVIIELNLESYRLEASKKPSKQSPTIAPDAEKTQKSAKHSKNHN